MFGESLDKGTDANPEVFQRIISDWEWKWVNTQKNFPVTPLGNAEAVSERLYEKYRKLVAHHPK
jgi:alpha-N-acetylglucosaminidase